jgi:hypothetical protein
MVTATHAARVLFEHFPALATEAAIGALWGAACVAHASTGAPAPAEFPGPDEATAWTEICAGAVRSNDDHVIKLAYTCRCENRRYRNPLYRAVAARLVAAGRALS